MTKAGNVLKEMMGNLDPQFPQISVDHETALSHRHLQSRKAEKKEWPKTTEEP